MTTVGNVLVVTFSVIVVIVNQISGVGYQKDHLAIYQETLN